MTTRHRLAAVWFADIVDFSGLAASDQRRAMRLVRLFQETTRESVDRCGGRVVKYLGDGAMAQFRSLHNAVAAAHGLRERFAEAAEEAGLGRRALRIGVHVGEVVERDGDVYGNGVNVAARIVEAAEPGEILVSGDARRQLREQVDVEFEDAGVRELQGVGEIALHRLVSIGSIEPDEAAPSRTGLAGLWDEIKRRHVFRVAAVYAVVAWLVVQVVVATFDPLNLPAWSKTVVVVAALVGFPIAVVVAWAFEWTPAGVRRTAPGSSVARLGRFAVAGVAILASLVVGWYAIDHGLNRQVASGVAETGIAPPDPSRLAVLYFEDRSADGALEGLASGLTESMIDQLGGLDSRKLKVLSRYAVQPFRGAEARLDSVALALGAGTLVKGSVEGDGDSLRVRAQLIDATDDLREIESWEVVRARADLFSLQDSLIADITGGLRRRLGERLVMRERREQTESVEAWEAVSQAERLIDQAEVAQSPDVKAALLAEADSLLIQAERLDRAWSEPVLLRAELGAQTRDRDAYMAGLAHAERALAMSSGRASALYVRGILRDSLASVAGDSTEAARWIGLAQQDLRRAVAMDPTLAPAWIALADLLYYDLWDLAKAIEAAERAHDEDAFLLESDHYILLCSAALQLEDIDEAWRWCREGRRRYPDRVFLTILELYILASPGEPANPEAAWSRVREVERQEFPEFNVPVAEMLTAAVLVRAQEPDSARQVLVRARSRTTEELAPYVAYFEAYAQILLGNRDQALNLLGTFLSAVPQERVTLAHDPWFETLAGDPRFERLVDRKRAPLYCRILCQPPEI